MSQAHEDRARTKRWRVLTQIVLSRRGRLVSRFGQNHVNSTTWTPSTPQRAAWSRPTRRHRSTRTSSPRWDRTARASEGCQVYEVSPPQKGALGQTHHQPHRTTASENGCTGRGPARVAAQRQGAQHGGTLHRAKDREQHPEPPRRATVPPPARREQGHQGEAARRRWGRRAARGARVRGAGRRARAAHGVEPRQAAASTPRAAARTP